MEKQNEKFKYLLPISVLISGLLIAGAIIYGAGLKSSTNSRKQISVVPSAGVELPVKWGNLGKQLIEAGVIDKDKLEALYVSRGGLDDQETNLLYSESNDNLVINSKNAGFVLNLLWALGLGNKNEVLEKGEMADPRYGGAGNFASTGGWPLAEGDPEGIPSGSYGAGAMAHYSKHEFITLSAQQQALVERVSKNIYRPCCGNPAHFPDCNHGMAMLGFLELAASQGASENQLYGMALVLNSYWFPQNYQTIAQYFKNRGIDWDKINAQEVLGQNFSSASGYQRILTQLTPQPRQGGGSCGV